MSHKLFFVLLVIVVGAVVMAPIFVLIGPGNYHKRFYCRISTVLIGKSGRAFILLRLRNTMSLIPPPL